MSNRALGRNQKSVVESMRGGAVMHRLFTDGVPEYFVEGLGRVSEDSVRRLVARGVIAERADGLFGVGITYQLTD